MMTELEAMSLADKFRGMTPEEQRIALKYFDTTIVLEEMSIRLETIQQKLRDINMISTL